MLTPRPLIGLIRPHQWVKNVFVIAPLFFSPRALTGSAVWTVCLGFLCFCAWSSAVYIVNDYLDRARDRLHPVKCRRPFAAGTVRYREALILFFVLLGVGFYGAYRLSVPFASVGLVYVALNVAYSLYLKHISIIDIVCISFGFILRIQAGALLIGVTPSVWILVCSGLLALFLAIAKRRDDLIADLNTQHRKSLKGYTLQYIDTCMTAVLSTLMVSYTIYTTNSTVMKTFGSTHLYLTVPFVFIGVFRYLQITLVEQRSGAPTRILFQDPLLFLAILGWVVVNGLLIYSP